jgi:Spy/CpxP family protein refolding chaperone
MKKLIRFVFVGILAVAIVFAVVHLALAQEQGGSDKADGGKGDGQQKWGHFDGLQKKLGLSDTQETQLKNLFKSRSEEVKPLRDQLQLDRDKLRLLVDKKAAESQLTDSMDKVNSDQEALKSDREKFRQKMKGILTPQQRAQMMVLREGGRHRGFGRFGRGASCGWGKRGMGHPGRGRKDHGQQPQKDETKDSGADPT